MNWTEEKTFPSVLIKSKKGVTRLGRERGRVRVRVREGGKNYLPRLTYYTGLVANGPIQVGSPCTTEWIHPCNLITLALLAQ